MLKNILKHILPLFLLVACGSKVDKTADAVPATFFVEKLEGSSIVSKIDPTYSIPKSRLYNFKACVKDILQSKAILGQSFKIEGGETTSIVNSDQEGCLNWSETVNYNFLAPANYVELSRTIFANGVHKGSFTVHAVLNPWGHGEDSTSVIDPSKQVITSLINENRAMSALTADGTKSPLWAIDPYVMIMNKEFTSNGASMMVKFQTKLSLILKNAASQNIQYQINTGKFDLQMMLYNSVVENGKEILLPLANGAVQNATFSQDTLMAEFPFSLSVLPNRGQNFMAIKITAPNNQVGLDPFEGVFLVSDDYNIKTDRQLSLVPTQKFNDVRSKFNESNIAKQDSAVLAKPGIEIDKLEINFLKIGSENTTDRQVFFNIKACMKSNLDNKSVRNESFVIKTVSGKTPIELVTNQEGCVSWDDSVWHKFFGSEHYVKSTVNISNANFNLNTEINILLNPWENGSNFGRDARFVDNRGSLAVNPSSEKAKIIFNSYSFNILKYNYDINKNLDLSLIKSGTLILNAAVAKHSSFSAGRMGNEMLRDGQYLLKWAVVSLDNDQKVNSVISLGQKLVTTLGGDIKTDVAFKVNAFEKLNQRSRLIVALYTVKENKNNTKSIVIDQSSGLDPIPYMAPIILNSDQDGQKMILVDSSLGLGNGDVFDRLSSIGTDRNMTKPEAVIHSEATKSVMAEQNLKNINLANEKESLLLRDGLANPNKYYTLSQNPAYFHEQEQQPVLNSAILSQFARTGKLSTDLATKFCSFWFNDYFRRLKTNSKTGPVLNNVIANITQTCIDQVERDPSQFFSIDKKLIVKKIGNIKYKKGTTSNISVGDAFSVGKSDSSTISKAWSWSSEVGLGLNLGLFKAGTSGGYAISKADASSRSSTNYVQVGRTTNLLLQTNTFNVELNSYEECSSIRLNPALFTGKNAQLGNIWVSTMKSAEIANIATAGFFICTGETNNKPIVKEENYYLVIQANNYLNEQQDVNSLENQTLFMTFRGQRDLSTFLNLIQGSIKQPESATSNFGASSISLGRLPSWPGAYSDAIN
jgi:hypothetical protein